MNKPNKKAFVINGGAGRVLCAIPALEHYAKSNNNEIVVISEAWGELFLSSKVLRDKVYQLSDKNLFNVLKDCEIISPEPYRLNAYFNQKVNMIQAFDMLINYDTPPEKIPDTKQFKLEIGKADQIFGYNSIEEIKKLYKKDKVVVFQPFGSGIKQNGSFLYDESGRSVEPNDTHRIVKELAKNYAVILFSNFNPFTEGELPVIVPPNVNLLQWSGIINAADYFIGCDSIGQHFANALNKPSTVIIGATYPENISYPDNKRFKIFDIGKENRQYSPLRITQDFAVERNNEELMVLDDTNFRAIIKSVQNVLGTKNKYVEPTNTTPPASDNTAPTTSGVPPGYKPAPPIDYPPLAKEILALQEKCYPLKPGFKLGPTPLDPQDPPPPNLLRTISNE
jgi:hypothetical protein